MPRSLVFSESNMIKGNVFKFEERLHTPVNKYIENGAILTTYFSQDEDRSTADRGSGDVDELYGKKSPLRWNQINDMPLFQFGQANPENVEEGQVEDINIEGECQIVPGTITPRQYDVFIVNHVKMVHLFEVTAVHYDSMKPDGYYKISYRLHSTLQNEIDTIKSRVINVYHMDLRAIGTSRDVLIREDDFMYRSRVEKMTNKMIDAYCALFYNERHNCFLFHHPETGLDWFDMCGNEFMARYSLMNRPDAARVIVLQDKIRDSRMGIYNNNSVYNWLEMGAPERLLQKFYFTISDAEAYPISSFAQWGDGNVQIMKPLSIQESGINNQRYSIFDEDQLAAFMDGTKSPSGSEYDLLIWKYIHMESKIQLRDISLTLGDALISSVKHIDTYLYTPMIIYIIRQILGMC